MSRYREIEDPAELRRLSVELTARMRTRARHAMDKVVGYPSGHDNFQVQFESRHGVAVRWWSSKMSESKKAMINLVGRGDPESNAYLMIDLQFNVPIKKFARTYGGAFVQDIESGAIVLAHRGIVSRGKARVEKESLLRHTTAATTTVLTSKGSIELFLVASLDSPNLLDDVAEFAEEIRQAADAAVASNGKGVRAGMPSASPEIDRRLGKYFDEFCGSRKLPRRGAVVMEVRHGRVVKRLAHVLSGLGKLLKSQQVDLAIKGAREVLLFEVKTSVSSTNLYTAIGQLLLHSVALEEQFPQSRVRRILVIPGSPSASIKRRLQESLGIEILTFVWKGTSSVDFDRSGVERLRA